MKIQAACTRPQSSMSYIHRVQSPQCVCWEEQGPASSYQLSRDKDRLSAGSPGKESLLHTVQKERTACNQTESGIHSLPVEIILYP
jgi:hypothetical protein